VLLYGTLLTATIVAGVLLRNRAQRSDGERSPVLAGGIFAFQYMEPFYPARPGGITSLAPTPTMTGDWNTLTNESQFVMMINDAGPFGVSVWVDGSPMDNAAQPVFSYPYLTVTFPGITLASGERDVFIRFVKDRENWGFLRTRMEVENAPCRDYEETVIGETNALFRVNERQGLLLEGLREFQRYLLIPCRYGRMNLNTLIAEIDGYARAFDEQGSEFWEIVAGKRLRKTEARLALRVFRKNWDAILAKIPASRPLVSPFVKLDMADSARRIVEVLKQKHQPPDEGSRKSGG
jgi:hypothetical protein